MDSHFIPLFPSLPSKAKPLAFPHEILPHSGSFRFFPRCSGFANVVCTQTYHQTLRTRHHLPQRFHSLVYGTNGDCRVIYFIFASDGHHYWKPYDPRNTNNAPEDIPNSAAIFLAYPDNCTSPLCFPSITSSAPDIGYLALACSIAPDAAC